MHPFEFFCNIIRIVIVTRRDRMNKFLLFGLIIIIFGLSPILSWGQFTESNPLANSHPLYKKLRDIEPRTESIQIDDLRLKIDAGEFHLKEGQFYPLELVNGKITGGVFIGSGGFTIKPALKSDQQHLKLLTDETRLQDNFKTLLIRFTDSKTYDTLKANGTIKPGKNNPAKAYLKKVKKLLRKGRDFVHYYNAVWLLKYNLDIRILMSLTCAEPEDYFFCFYDGEKYGQTIFIVDPLGAPEVAPEQVLLACVSKKNQGIWMAQHLQNEKQRGPVRWIDVEKYEIDSTIKKTVLEATVDVTFRTLEEGIRVIPFNLYRKCRVKNVFDGNEKSLHFIQEKEKEDANFAVILPQGLPKGKSFTLQFDYTSKEVIKNEGSGNYALKARYNWYPFRGFSDYAHYDLKFRIPSKYQVVSTGTLVNEESDDSMRFSHWKSEMPLSVAGFNYGSLKKKTQENKESGITLETYINKDLPDYIKAINLGGGNRLDTSQMADAIMTESQIATQLFHQWYGEIPFKRIAITQQPQPNFGQAWPTLVYMPLKAYFTGKYFYKNTKTFQKYVGAHEIAHQWWGNTIGDKTYRDQWLNEALSEFSSSIFAQYAYKQKGLKEFWKDLKKRALKRNTKGKIPAKSFSLTLGYRADTALSGKVASRMIYCKGPFVIHMIRMMMWHPKTGDSRFQKMMKDYLRQHKGQGASTADFKRSVEKHMTPEMDLDKNRRLDWFFNQWVEGNLIPHYKLEYRIDKGSKSKYLLTCRITQSKVDDSFKMVVPVYLDFGKKVIRLGNVPITGNTSTPPLKINLPKKPKRVLLCAYEDILCTTKVQKTIR